MKKRIIKNYVLRYSVKNSHINSQIRKIIIPARTLQSAIEILSIALSEFYKEFTIVY